MKKWSTLPDEILQSFVATVAVAVLRAAPGERSEVDAMRGIITLPDRGQKLDLRDLAERCAAVDHSEWQRLIDAQVERWMQPVPTTSLLSFDEAAPLLRVRLVNASDEVSLSRTLATGLVAELCTEEGGSAGVTQETADAWGHSEGELWQLAIANLGTDDAVIDSFVLDEPVELSFFHVHGEGAFIASLALRLPDLAETLPRYGWLFMVPHRQSLWFAPLMDLSHGVVGMLMVERAVDELRGSQIPISGHMYWTNGNRITAVPLDGVETGEDLAKAIVAVARAGNAS